MHRPKESACMRDQSLELSILSLLSIGSDDDISVGFRPCALLVGERVVQSELKIPFRTEDDSGRSIRKAMAESVIMLVFL